MTLFFVMLDYPCKVVNYIISAEREGSVTHTLGKESMQHAQNNYAVKTTKLKCRHEEQSKKLIICNNYPINSFCCEYANTVINK